MVKIARPLKAIRLKCYDCSGWSWPEVAKCVDTDCILYPFRFGKKPKGVKFERVSAEEYAQRVENGNGALSGVQE